MQKPISKLDDDAYTRVCIILMNGIELESRSTPSIGKGKNKKIGYRLR